MHFTQLWSSSTLKIDLSFADTAMILQIQDPIIASSVAFALIVFVTVCRASCLHQYLLILCEIATQ